MSGSVILSLQVPVTSFHSGNGLQLAGTFYYGVRYMGIRYTDPLKWKKKFIKSLPTSYLLFWLYLTDECPLNGIWHVELDVVKFRTSGDNRQVDIELNKAIELFGDRVIPFDKGNKWFIPTIITIQQPKGLGSNNLHMSIKRDLNKYTTDEGEPLINIYLRVSQGLTKGNCNSNSKSICNSKSNDGKTEYDINNLINPAIKPKEEREKMYSFLKGDRRND